MTILSSERSHVLTEKSNSAVRGGSSELLIKEAREASRRRRLGRFTFFIVALVAAVTASFAVVNSKPSPQIGSGSNVATGRALTATARVLCQDVLGARALNSEPATVSAVRQFGYGPEDSHPARNAFRALGTNQVVGLCWTGRPRTGYRLYAVASHYAPVRIEGVTGAGFTSTPAPGFIDIP